MSLPGTHIRPTDGLCDPRINKTLCIYVLARINITKFDKTNKQHKAIWVGFYHGRYAKIYTKVQEFFSEQSEHWKCEWHSDATVQDFLSSIDIAHFEIDQQIDVHEVSLCVLLVFEILWSSTNLTFVLTLCAWCVFRVFGCALSVYHLSSHWVRVCLLLSLRCYRAHDELKWFQMVGILSRPHCVNWKLSMS